MSMETEKRIFRIVMRRHSKTGLIAAISPDHSGLNLFGHSEEELESLIPAAIQALMEAEGHHVVDIVELSHPDEDVPDFDNPNLVASALLQIAA